MKISFASHLLEFKFNAGTSRGVLKTRKVWIVKLEQVQEVGIGEIAPLKGLSTEGYESFEPKLIKELQLFKKAIVDDDLTLGDIEDSLSSSTLFGLESALLNLKSFQEGQVFSNSFFINERKIPINGLVWMGNAEFMKNQVREKLEKGFSCIKMKIGAIGFEKEVELLQDIRGEFTEEELTLRVDANGAFSFEEAKRALNKLNELGIHSIEQPIKAGQWERMQALCEYASKTGIALDEELIGVRNTKEKISLLDTIKPQYIILKPTLHGGISGTQEWIRLAEEREINWWITSALESNIGLNAICQLTNEYPINRAQGLGTGSLYHNNIPSPLELDGEFIYYNSSKQWNFNSLDFVGI